MFWLSYGFCMVWAFLAAAAIYRFAPLNENFQNLNVIESALSAKMSFRRMVMIVVGAVAINLFFFSEQAP